MPLASAASNGSSPITACKKKLYTLNPANPPQFVQTQRTRKKQRSVPADPKSLERQVRQLLADKISGNQLGIWLLLFGRTWNEGRRARDASVRLALAADLGLSPREVASLTTKGLFKLREQAAFDDLTGVMQMLGHARQTGVC